METQATQRRYACDEADLAPGESMTLDGDDPVALFRTADGDFYATSDSCTHEEWSLGEDSDLDGCQVECPLHLARFDLRTGEALCYPATEALRTYEVSLDDGKVYVLA
ncbi:bifunctional 3-phenylpropionate/cinnamic acid dioxygenase ferredoxin subunit [soil metagenome]